MSNSAQNKEIAPPVFWAGESNAARNAARSALQGEVYTEPSIAGSESPANGNATLNPAARQQLAGEAAKPTGTEWLPATSVTNRRPIEIKLYRRESAADQEHARKGSDKSTENKPDNKSADKSDNPSKGSKFDKELFAAINEWRVKHGLKELKFSSSMKKMADANNSAMRRQGKLGHLAYGGYEVAGMGYRTPKATLQGWLNSPAHKRIIASRNISKMGASGDGKWETAHFA